MTQPHDALFKFTFTQPNHARSVLQSALPANVSRHIDWGSLTAEPTQFVDADLRQQHVDVLYRVQLAGHEAFLHVLFEHQRDADPLMPYRLLRYCVAIWQEYLRKHPNATRLPPVLPIVLHHSPTGWRGPRRLSACWALDHDSVPDIRPHLPELAFILDDLSHQDDQALLRRTKTDLGRLVLTAFRDLPNHPAPLRFLEHAAGILRRVADSQGGVEAVRALLSYATQVAELDLDELRDYVEHTIDDQAAEAIMGMTSWQLMEKSRQEGREEGKTQGKVDVLLRVLGKKFGPLPETAEQRVRSADAAKLDAWAEQIVDAQSLDEALR